MYVSAEGVCRQVPYEVGKVMAARDLCIRLHEYDAGSSKLISIMGAEPPALFRRALVACSGSLPKYGRSPTVEYSDVPEEVANLLLNKLYVRV